MSTTQRQANAWIDPDDIDPLANHLQRQSTQTRYRDCALIRLLADIGLKPGEIACDNPETVIQISDVSLAETDDGWPSDPTPPSGGCVLVRRDVATVESPKDIVVSFQDAKTAMVLHRHLVNLEDPSPDDPLFASANAGPLSKQYVRDIISRAAETANIRPVRRDGYGTPGDVTPLTLRHTAAYRQLRAGENVDAVAKRQRLTDAGSAGYFLAQLAAAATE